MPFRLASAIWSWILRLEAPSSVLVGLGTSWVQEPGGVLQRTASVPNLDLQSSHKNGLYPKVISRAIVAGTLEVQEVVRGGAEDLGPK